jgi:Cdc6-like AAA superfamily ATPase
MDYFYYNELSLYYNFLRKVFKIVTTLITGDCYTGAAGSGKTTLARTICRELEKAPHFVHCIEAQCKHLKGMLHFFQI